jgi:hypothetical protein
MTNFEPLLATGDATLQRYERTFERLTLELQMWDETTKVITASGVTKLVDTGTWEVDGIVRVPEFDDGELSGYGIVDTEGNLTLQFTALELDL